MKKILLFNLLLAMTFVTTSLKAADGDVFTAPVTVIYAGETQQVTMRFQVTSESDKTCSIYATYDEVSATSNPAIYYAQGGEVIIPEKINGYTIISIGSDAFHGCYLERIKLPETIKAIYAEAFEESHLQEIDLPSSVAYVGDFCFAYCSRLISAKISGTIENGCFYDCPRLEQIEFKSPVTSVGVVAFTSCTSLRSITFPSGLKTIDMGAFGDCKTLAEVTLPSSTESIKASAFWGCTNLRNVVIARETPPTIDPVEHFVLFADVFSSAVLHVPDRTKYTSESWASNFSEIRSFLPTNEKTYGFYNLGASGWGWIVYTNDPNKVLDLKIDGEPKAPTFYGTNIIVSDDPKQIPLEVSYLMKTDEGIQPNIIHYDLFDYGFSIDGKELTSRDFYNVPGVVSGKAYIKDEFVLGGENNLRWKKEPKLVLDNATLEWDTTGYGLNNHDTGQAGLTIKALGDCTIKAPNAVAALEIDIAKMITIEGGGTLHIISGQYPIETYIVSTLRIQDGTTVIAKSENGYSAVWDQDGADIEIRDGGVFAAFGKHEPIWLDSNGEFILGEGIALRYPIDAYIGSNNNIYYADGTEVKNDWVVIGPDNATTWELIDGVGIVNADDNDNLNASKGIYNLAGQKVGESYKGIVIKNGKKIIKK